MQIPLSVQLLYPLIQIYTFVVILRAMMQYLDADFHNTFSQVVNRLTSLPIRILRIVTPRIQGSDMLSPLVLVMLVAGADRAVVISLSPFDMSVPALVVMTIAVVIDRAITIMIIAILIRVVLSWVRLGFNNFERLVATFTEPVMRPARRLLPSFGGLDFTPILVLLGLELTSWIAVGFLDAAGLQMLRP